MGMLLFGMDETEMRVLTKWATQSTFQLRAVVPERYLIEWRYIWMRAGGKLPITEVEALFLKPKQEDLAP